MTGLAERGFVASSPRVGDWTVMSERTPLPLVFDEPRGRKKPPRHLADLSAAERKLSTVTGRRNLLEGSA